MQQLKRYRLVAERSKATVTAQAPGHSFKASGGGVEGTIELDGDRVVALDAKFPLANLDAGDPISNHELTKFLGLKKQPTATAKLVGPDRILFQIGAGKMEVPVKFAGRAPEGSARFVLTFTGLGYTPPKMLFLKVKDTLEIEVSSALAIIDG